MFNKVSLKNPKDQNFETHNGKVLNMLEKAAQKLFKDKAFHEEFKAVFAVSSLLKYLSNFVSFLTGFIAIQMAVSLLCGAYLSAFIAFGVCLMLEAVKAFVWKINSKWMLKYKRLSRSLLGTLVALHLISLGLSAYGGYMLPLSMRTEELPVLESLELEQITSSYDRSIMKLDSLLSLNSAKVTATTSNSTVRSLNKISNSLLSQKEYQEKAKSAAILSATQKHEEKQAEIRESASKRRILKDKRVFVAQISCLVASVFFELAFILCSLFGVYYLFRLNIELEADTTAVSTSENSPSRQRAESKENQAVTLSRQQPSEAPKIGFTSNAKKCQLNGCSKSFVSKVHNKKYCSDECRKMAYQERKYSQNQEN